MILLYHHIAPAESIPRDDARFRDEGWHFTHSPGEFEFHLLELQRRGYRFISLDQLVIELHTKGAERPDSAVITFDDGWMDNYTFALPVLTKLGLPATFFVTTAHLSNAADDRKRMNADQLRELACNGHIIGTHSRTHSNLSRLSNAEARNEIMGCKEDLEDSLGTQVDFFAYPGGAFNTDVTRITRDAGYKAACSVLGPKTNKVSSLFWLFRDVLSPGMNTLGDRYRLSQFIRRILSFRVSRKLKRRLAQA